MKGRPARSRKSEKSRRSVVRIFLIFSRSATAATEASTKPIAAAAEVLAQQVAGFVQDCRGYEEAAFEALHEGGAAAVPPVRAGPNLSAP